MIIVVSGLYGCTNPGGTPGPSWDITLKIPLIKGTEENTMKIEDLLGDDVDLQEGFKVKLLESSEGLYALGEELAGLNFTGFSASIDLEPVEIDGLIDNSEFNVEKNKIEDGIELDIGSIEINAEFESLRLADKSQKVVAAIVSDGDTSGYIYGLRVEVFNDGNNIASFDFGDITANMLENGVEAEWDMKNQNFTDNEIALKLSVKEVLLDKDIILSVQFPPKLKVAEAIGLKLADFSNLEAELESEISLAGLNLKKGVKKIGFSTGNISIDVSSEADNFTGLVVEDLIIGGLCVANGLISLAGRELSFPEGEKLDAKLSLRASDELISFSSDSLIKLNGNFEGIGIAYLEVNIDEAIAGLDFDGELVIDELEIELEDKLRDELYKLEISPEIIMKTAWLEGMKLEPFALVFKTFDDSGNPVGEEISFDIEFSGSGNSIIDIRALFDRIKGSGVSKIRGVCNYGLSGGDVIVAPDTEIGIESIELRVPYEFSLNEDIEFKLVPERAEPFDNESREMLKKDVKGMLVIEDLHNNLPLAATFEVYAAVIPDPGMTDEELKEALYKPENLLKRKTLDQREFYEKYLLEVEKEDLDLFTEENVYIGIRIIVPANKGEDKYRFIAGDKLTFSSIYLSLTGHINLEN